MPRVVDCDVFDVVLPRGARPRGVLVRVTGEDGHAGWGEAACPAARGGGPDGPWDEVRARLAPTVVGLDWDRPEDLAAVTDLAGPAASAAVESACWDLWCRGRGLPLAHALGGTRTSVVTGYRLPAADPEALPGRVSRAVGAGHTRVTLPIRPGLDVESIRAVRAAFPALAVVCDAGGAYAADDADHLAALEALDAYEPLAVAHPYPRGDLAAHARLQARLRAPVALEVGDLDTLEAAVELGAGAAVDLRFDRLGGLTAARAVHDRAYAAGWDMWVTGVGSFGVGQSAAVALAALPGCTLPGEVTDPSGGPVFVSPPVRSSGGVAAVPLTQPGIGHTVDERRIAKLSSRHARVTV